MNVGGDGIEELCRIEGKSGHERGVEAPVERDGFLHAVVADAEAAAHDQPISTPKQMGQPRKSDLRTPVVFAGLVQVSPDLESQTGEEARTRAENRVADVVIFFRERTEVFPAQAEIDRKIRFASPVVLHKKGVDAGADVLLDIRRAACQRIKIPILLIGGVICEVPQVLEVVGRPRRPRGLIVVLFLVNVCPEFQRVAVLHLG